MPAASVEPMSASSRRRPTPWPFAAGATYTLEGTGSAQVDRFEIEAEAPAAPAAERVGDVALGEGAALDEAEPTVVRWREAPGDKGREDVVLVDVSAASGASVRCAFRDTGRATLPGWIFAAAELGALPATATVAVHRVRERAFNVSGLDAGAVRFDLSIVGPVTVTPAAAIGPVAAPAPQP